MKGSAIVEDLRASLLLLIVAMVNQTKNQASRVSIDRSRWQQSLQTNFHKQKKKERLMGRNYVHRKKLSGSLPYVIVEKENFSLLWI